MGIVYGAYPLGFTVIDDDLDPFDWEDEANMGERIEYDNMLDILIDLYGPSEPCAPAEDHEDSPFIRELIEHMSRPLTQEEIDRPMRSMGHAWQIPDGGILYIPEELGCGRSRGCCCEVTGNFSLTGGTNDGMGIE